MDARVSWCWFPPDRTDKFVCHNQGRAYHICGITKFEFRGGPGCYFLIYFPGLRLFLHFCHKSFTNLTPSARVLIGCNPLPYTPEMCDITRIITCELVFADLRLIHYHSYTPQGVCCVLTQLTSQWLQTYSLWKFLDMTQLPDVPSAPLTT